MIMQKVLWRLTDNMPLRIINDGDRPYLERYFLFCLLGWVFYIHRFVGSDPDRGVHDHPWRRAFSIILSGWYIEETRIGIREVHWFNSLTGDTFHRVILPRERAKKGNGGAIFEGKIIDLLFTDNEIPCWTLFFHTEKNVKRWGFLYPLRHGIQNGEQIFKPYEYTREGNQQAWWKTAKSRKQLRMESA